MLRHELKASNNLHSLARKGRTQKFSERLAPLGGAAICFYKHE